MKGFMNAAMDGISAIRKDSNTMKMARATANAKTMNRTLIKIVGTNITKASRWKYLRTSTCLLREPGWQAGARASAGGNTAQ
mmetsp:Transcript_93133/g.161871  ORF Transcript_93133/g.161871 Transcript_93133/m.161871 type:complete len:82 (-) Transcript_93133:417-662(-)